MVISDTPQSLKLLAPALCLGAQGILISSWVGMGLGNGIIELNEEIQLKSF